MTTAQRADHARALTQRRSDEVRAGIRRAVPSEIKASGLNLHGLATAIRERISRLGPERFGLKRVPDVETISAVLCELRFERQGRTGALYSEIDTLKPERARFLLKHSTSSSST